jgi:hypothetical protein
MGTGTRTGTGVSTGTDARPPRTPGRFRRRRLASVLLTLAALGAAPAAPALAAQPAKAATRPCPVRTGRVACVDLTHQTMWVQQGRNAHRVFGKVHIRSGRKGYRTRTGWFKVYWRHIDHVSTIYGSPMPYSQFFSGGQAFHAVSGSVHSRPGSYGCVNLTRADAKRLWSVLHKGDAVHVRGRKPGT